MKESIISELFNEAVARAELIRPEGEEYETMCAAKEQAEADFFSTFIGRQQELFEAFMECYNEVMALEEEEAFRHGVSIGVRITAESFLLPEKRNT